MKGTIAAIKPPHHRVLFLFEDRGDIVPSYDDKGRSQPAWTSYYEIDGEPLYVQTFKEVSGGHPLAARREIEDRKAIAALGYDLNTVKEHINA